MEASTKLGEIDSVLREVQKGVDEFDSIWNKVDDKHSANQKEKIEAELKKEVETLQIYRDGIKTLIESVDVKDEKVRAFYKQALMDYREQIELEMEWCKICEKETKAFLKKDLRPTSNGSLGTPVTFESPG